MLKYSLVTITLLSVFLMPSCDFTQRVKNQRELSRELQHRQIKFARKGQILIEATAQADSLMPIFLESRPDSFLTCGLKDKIEDFMMFQDIEVFCSADQIVDEKLKKIWEATSAITPEMYDKVAHSEVYYYKGDKNNLVCTYPYLDKEGKPKLLFFHILKNEVVRVAYDEK